MMELNREQIIKMLETIDEVGDCSRDCIFYNGKVHSCGGTIAKHALALIKELTEENEKLSHHCDDCAGCLQWNCDCANIRDKAITEFAEKLQYTLCINNEDNTEYFDYAYTLETIDQVAKELLEENK
jgi:hypothetical protein